MHCEIAMRDPARELRAARSLHRWLRRAALSAIPIAGLAGCGSDCNRPDYDQSAIVDAGVPWPSGTQHSASECSPYCDNPLDFRHHDPCSTSEITGCQVSSQTTVVCHIHYTWCYQGQCGRLPAGLLPDEKCGQPSLAAAYLANAARLEGAALFAFRAVERELIAHGAPADLIARARSAQRDEERHHTAMSGLARRYGAPVGAVEVEDVAVRPLVEVALENAVEGCVRETYGAAVAAFQGECAGDRAVRRAMRSIARDEAEHAALGWAIDGWALGLLRPRERARVEAARQEALEQLRAQTTRASNAPELSTALGLPDAAASARLFTALAPLWSQRRFST